MDPIVIYAGMAGLGLAAGIGVMLSPRAVMRTCLKCGGKTQLGVRRCKRCGYVIEL